jgi:hypothetical protein
VIIEVATEQKEWQSVAGEFYSWHELVMRGVTHHKRATNDDGYAAWVPVWLPAWRIWNSKPPLRNGRLG